MGFLATNRTKRLLAAVICLRLCANPAAAGEQEWQVLTALGEAALQQKNFTLAEKQFAAALTQAEDFSPRDPRLGRTLNNLATVQNALGRTEAAEPLLQRALKIWQGAPAGNELQLATTLHNLAGIAYGKDDKPAAMDFLEQALTLREKALPANHAALTRTRKSLATLGQVLAPKAAAKPPTPLAKPKQATQQAAVDPAARTTGGFAIHLASLKGDEQAKREWRRLRQAFPELLGKLALTLEPVDLGDRGVFQRILSGPFKDRAAANQTCAQLKTKQQYCQVVKAKDVGARS